MSGGGEDALRRTVWFVVVAIIALTAASVIGWCLGGYL